ncbi:MAG: hypothetical protein MUF50_01935 [Planctomycetes bacterium]|jgi:hypothetical protein|nr:hypothetical protein [Planctomycetota bacterium]
MPKDLKDIRANIMGDIRHGKLKMRPKIYFIIASILVLSGLVASALSSIFLFSLIRFSLRSHGPMGQYRWDQIIAAFPWWAVVLGIFGLIVGIWLVRKYNFFYKINFKIIIIGFVAIIVIAGYLVDLIGLNDVFHRKGYFNHIYKQKTGQGLMFGTGKQINNLNK